ncbi:neo-calmodulin-like [Pecten maximus]|uniref:neo-calmodulin-like n=1 Tax=Pecten maximus TaxID=6579 RepID=UPI001458200F|nr:neo-calmodulin-like [Pecten maximus]
MSEQQQQKQQQQQQVEGEVDEKTEILRVTFNYFDKNKDGTVSVSELGKVFQSLGQNPTNEQIRQMISVVDADNNGILNFEEFRKFVEKYQGAQTQDDREADLRRAFEIIDKNNSGYISLKEFKTLVKSVGERLTDEEIKEMLDVADIDKDEKISYAEFAKILAS